MLPLSADTCKLVKYCAGGGALPATHSASSPASQGGMWAKLVAPFASSSSHTVLLGRRHSALLTPIGRCHGALYSPWPFCAPLWLPVALAVALAGSPAGSPTGLQLQMCLGAAHWLAAPAHRLFGPPLAMPPNHAHPPTTHKLSMLLQPRALCSLLSSHPRRTAISNRPTDQPAGRQCSAVSIQCSPAQRRLFYSRHPEKRPGAPSSWPAANRFLLQPRTLPFSSSLLQLALPAVIPIIPQTPPSPAGL